MSDSYAALDFSADVAEDALKDLRTALGSEAGLLEGLSRNPLPASFEVVFTDVESPETGPQRIKKVIEQLDGVDEVQYSEEWLKQFKGLLGLIRMTGLIIGGLLCLGILFIITNTIKLTIYSRKEEIEILKLVGATDWFVKIPFLLEGAIQGILSGILALLILLSGYYLFTAEKLLFTGVGVFDLIFLPPKYSLLIFLASIILGLAGSLIAVRRFFDI